MDGKDFTGTLCPEKMQLRMVEIWGVLTGGRFEKGTGRSLTVHLALGATGTNVAVQFSKECTSDLCV